MLDAIAVKLQKGAAGGEGRGCSHPTDAGVPAGDTAFPPPPGPPAQRFERGGGGDGASVGDPSGGWEGAGVVGRAG